LAAVKVTVNSSVMVSVVITIGVDSVSVSPEQSEAVILSNTDEDNFAGRSVMVLLSDLVTVATDGTVNETSSSEKVEEADILSSEKVEEADILSSEKVEEADILSSEKVEEAETSSEAVSEVSAKLLDAEVMLAVSLVVRPLLVVDRDVDELVYNGKGVINEDEELEEEVSESRFCNLLARTRVST
jgi:hypothetical protein